MNWIAGLVAGVVVYLADWVLWTYVFRTGMDAYVTQMSPEEMKKFMGPALAKSAVLSLAFGFLFAWFYGRFHGALWVAGGGPLAGMEFATVLWVPILLAMVGSSVWYTTLSGSRRESSRASANESSSGFSSARW